MGCCTVSQRQVHKEAGIMMKQEKETSVESVNSAQTVKEEVALYAASKQLDEFICKLREVYGFQSEKHYWFDSTCLPQTKQQYTFQTKNYIVQCEIADPNVERLSTFKFALIAPQWQQDQHSPPFFIYCLQQIPTSAQVLPIQVKIQQTKIHPQQHNFQFTANLNNIIKLILHVQLKIPSP